MSEKTPYLVLAADSSGEMEKLAAVYLKMGYVCQGGISVITMLVPEKYGSFTNRLVYYQAMILMNGDVGQAEFEMQVRKLVENAKSNS